MDSQTLEKEIIDAFNGEEVPRGRLVEVAYAEDAQAFFEGTTWHSHTPSRLRTQDAAMHYFTPEAFRYYLPAYMLAELRDPETADILGEHVVSQFAKPESCFERTFQSRMCLFSKAQRRVILAFIIYMQEKYGGFEQELAYVQSEFGS